MRSVVVVRHGDTENDSCTSMENVLVRVGGVKTGRDQGNPGTSTGEVLQHLQKD